MLQDEVKQKVGELFDKLRPSLHKHGGNAKLAEIGEDFIRLELQGACRGCPMSAVTFGLFLKDEIKKRLPQIKNVFYEQGTNNE